jgi:hypothetical protein
VGCGRIGGEFLWDFCALIEDEAVPPDDRFSAQAAIVGEVEWATHEIEKDFEKLLPADSFICFMTFQKQTAAEAKRKLDWLEAAVSTTESESRGQL